MNRRLRNRFIRRPAFHSTCPSSQKQRESRSLFQTAPLPRWVQRRIHFAGRSGSSTLPTTAIPDYSSATGMAASTIFAMTMASMPRPGDYAPSGLPWRQILVGDLGTTGDLQKVGVPGAIVLGDKGTAVFTFNPAAQATDISVASGLRRFKLKRASCGFRFHGAAESLRRQRRWIRDQRLAQPGKFHV